MNVEEVLKDARIEALEADPDETVCLVVTVSKDTELTEDLSNDIYHSVLLGLAETKWADIPIFVVPEGTTIKAVVVPKREGNVDKPNRDLGAGACARVIDSLRVKTNV